MCGGGQRRRRYVGVIKSVGKINVDWYRFSLLICGTGGREYVQLLKFFFFLHRDKYRDTSAEFSFPFFGVYWFIEIFVRLVVGVIVYENFLEFFIILA